MERKYSEVRIDFYDDINEHWCVDAWTTDDDNEEGKVVATIDDKGNITWLDKDAENDQIVAEEIAVFLKEEINAE